MATITGLKFLQLAANRAALKDKMDVVDADYQTVLRDFERSKLFPLPHSYHKLTSTTVDGIFRQKNVGTREALQVSRDIVAEHGERDDTLIEEMCEKFQEPRTRYKAELVQAEADGRTPPSDEGI